MLQISILAFADSVLGIRPYDWQCRILLNYEAGHQTAAACANFTGKTSPPTSNHRNKTVSTTLIASSADSSKTSVVLNCGRPFNPRRGSLTASDKQHPRFRLRLDRTDRERFRRAKTHNRKRFTHCHTGILGHQMLRYSPILPPDRKARQSR